jgi:hypothetical protein
MGLNTDTDKSLTEIVNDLNEELDYVRNQLEVMKSSRDKWKQMAEFFANRMVTKLGE